MTDLLKEIIDVDKAARERLAAAQAEKNEAYASIASRKEALINEEKRKARKKAEEISQKNRAEGEEALRSVREKNSTIAEKMNALYAENKERWITEIVDGVLKGTEV
ncbi:MAG: hypothetical protein IJ766_06715 [Clostridia bacterium]|nr:hypothetical protein [Clostridia bacterium]